MCFHFSALLQTQRSLSKPIQILLPFIHSIPGQTFLELQHHSINPPDLTDQFLRNSQCQTVLSHNGETLLSNDHPLTKLFFL